MIEVAFWGDKRPYKSTRLVDYNLLVTVIQIRYALEIKYVAGLDLDQHMTNHS